MSLRWFHLFFISLATLLFWGLATICLQSYRVNPLETGYLIGGVIGVILGAMLFIYGVLFAIKMKRL